MNLIQTVTAAAAFVLGSVLVTALSGNQGANAAQADLLAAEKAIADGIPVKVTNPVTTVKIDATTNAIKIDANANNVKLDPARNIIRIDPAANTVKLDGASTVKLDPSATIKVDNSVTPFNYSREFPVSGIGGGTNFTVPAGKTLVVESFSGRIALPAQQHVNLIHLFQINTNAPASNFLYAQPTQLLSNTLVGGIVSDVFQWNNSSRQYLTGTVEFDIAKDFNPEQPAPTQVNVSITGYLIPTPTP